MQKDVILCENFYEDPAAVARYAMGLRYCTPYNELGDEEKNIPIAWRTSWFTPAKHCPFKSSAGLIAKLEALTGETIDTNHWHMDFPIGEDGLPPKGYEKTPRSAWWNCSFHVKHHSQVLGEGVHNHNNDDPWNAVGPLGWAGIIYLNEDAPKEGGLRTWNNVRGNNDFRFTPKEDWEPVDHFANIYNRLILHRGYIPHSGAPGWGSKLTNGRLYQTFFFATTGTKKIESVSRVDVALPPTPSRPY